jgi:cytochrome c-type biogenesis protein CcmF
MTSVETLETMHAWINPTVQRLAVVSLASLGFLAALSNAMLAYRVFRAKPLAAGGWLAHVGIGLMMVGVIVSNTYERTERFVLEQNEPPVEKFGYKFAYEGMTGKVVEGRPFNPDFDLNNAIQIRVTPPGVDDKSAAAAGSSDGSPKTFVIAPRWFVHNLHTAESEDQLERMRWPSITKYLGHDLYVSLANDAQYRWPTDDLNRERPGIVLRPKETRMLGSYKVTYLDSKIVPGTGMDVYLGVETPEGKRLVAAPGIRMGGGGVTAVNAAIPDIRDENGLPGAAFLDKLDPMTKEATLRISLPGFAGAWAIPLEVTFKPWINLVWIGVLVAVAGTLLAMLRRALEARHIAEHLSELPDLKKPVPVPQREVWEMPEAEEPALVGAAAAAPAAPSAPANGGNGSRPANGPKRKGKGKSGASAKVS